MALGSDFWYLLLHFGLVDTQWIPIQFAVLAKAMDSFTVIRQLV
jgi:hypothetical protein